MNEVLNGALKALTSAYAETFPAYTWVSGWPKNFVRNTILVQFAQDGDWLDFTNSTYGSFAANFRVMPLFPATDIKQAQANLVNFITEFATDKPVGLLGSTQLQAPTITTVGPMSVIDADGSGFLGAEINLSPITVNYRS